MKAIRFVGVNQPAEIIDVPEPRPGPGEVVVAVEAAGLCHSDLHILDGSFPAPAPMTLGHEVAGRVLEVGAGVDETGLEGTRFVLKGTGQRGGPSPGLGGDGGLAERVLIPASFLMPVPDGIGMGQAAVATDSVATAYHAVKGVGGVRLGEKVGIIGLGGLGLNAVTIAAIAGARVYGCNRSPAKREEALKVGAHEVYADAGELAGMDLDCVIDFVGIGPTVNAAIAAARDGGRVVLVGLGANEVQFPTLPLIQRQISAAGAWGSTRQELTEVLGFIAEGRISSVLEEISLDEVPEGYERLHRGEVPGRLVAMIGR
ncbi:MAG: molecular chaperone GroES [Arthrobacter sp.]|nr:molecular chaperone GroES [Arthrobacter sp.]